MVTLDDVLGLVRDGKADLATAVVNDLPERDRPRALLAIAYRSGDTARAVELASALWSMRRWDATVVAVLTLHGTGPIKEAASATLATSLEVVETDLAKVAAELDADPTSLPSWRRLVRALVHSERTLEAVEGVALALQEGQVGRDLWAMLGTEMLVAGVAGTAAVADLGVRWFPSDPDVHALAALLYVSTGNLSEAGELATRAIRLNPSCGFAYIAEAAVLAAGGRSEEANRSLRRGVALGVDPAFGVLGAARA